MKILLKDNKEYEVEYFSESFRIDDEENENNITIEIKEDLSLEEMKTIFTQDALSSGIAVLDIWAGFPFEIQHIVPGKNDVPLPAVFQKGK